MLDRYPEWLSTSTFPCTLSKSATTRATVVLPVPGLPRRIPIGENTILCQVGQTFEPWNTMCNVGLPPGEGMEPSKNIAVAIELVIPKKTWPCLVFPSPFLSYAAPSGVWRKVILRTWYNEKLFKGLMILRMWNVHLHLDSTLFHRFQTNDAIQAFECSLFKKLLVRENDSLLHNPSV